MVTFVIGDIHNSLELLEEAVNGEFDFGVCRKGRRGYDGE